MTKLKIEVTASTLACAVAALEAQRDMCDNMAANFEFESRAVNDAYASRADAARAAYRELRPFLLVAH